MSTQFVRSLRLSLPLVLLIALAQQGTAYGLGGDKKGFGNDKNIDIPQWALDASKVPTPTGNLIKDARAVVLYDEYVDTVDAQGRMTERERQVIRILQPQGRRERVSIDYDVDEKLNYLHVWTITADGKHYQAKDADFREVGGTGDAILLSTRRMRVATPPAMDIGATIIAESEVLRAPYQRETIWGIQSSLPVVFQALEVDLPSEQKYTAVWHKFKPVEPTQPAPNRFRWELKDMPALTLRDIPSHPEWSALVARMSVQWGDIAATGTENHWKALGEWVTKLEVNRPDPSPEIAAQTQSLIAGAPDFYTKLSRITEYIQKNIRYFVVIRGIGGMQAHPASSIFANHYGDCKDKTTLLISMLQVAGIHAFYMPVDDRRGIVDPEFPSLVGNHMITAIEVPDSEKDSRLVAIAKAKDGRHYLIFDPTNERTPVGNLPTYLQGGYGLLSAGSSSQILAIPVLPAESNGTEQKGSFIVAEDGTIKGIVHSKYSGPGGGDARLFLKYRDENERRKIWEGEIASTLTGATLEAFDFTQPEALDKPLELHYKVSAGDYMRKSGPLMLVRARVLGTYASAFDDKPRTVAIDLEHTGHWHDSFDITLPEGYMADELPDPVNRDMDFASYHSSVTAKGNVLHYERDYTLRKIELPADRYEDYRKMQGTILRDEKSLVVMKKK